MALLAAHALPGVAGAQGSKAMLSFPLRPTELEVPTKTGIFDASVVLDLPRQQFLAPLALAVRAATPESALFFPFSLAEFRARFLVAAAAVGAAVLCCCPYSLRHGGASHDRSVLARSLSDVQARGMWRSRT